MALISDKLKKEFLTFEEGKELVASTLKTGRGIEILNKIISEKKLLKIFIDRLKITNKFKKNVEKKIIYYSLWFIERKIKSKLIENCSIFFDISNSEKFLEKKRRSTNESKNDDMSHNVNYSKKFNVDNKNFQMIYKLFRLEIILKRYVNKLLQFFFFKCDNINNFNFLKNKLKTCIKDNLVSPRFNFPLRKFHTYFKYPNIKTTTKNKINDFGNIYNKILYSSYDDYNMKKKKKKKNNSSKSYTLLPLIPYYYNDLPSIKMSNDYMKIEGGKLNKDITK
ncbi:conserved Plasmodium protein, unknown function [Plasmodium yoelii]|uniref:Uncharacterized protein n=2 Tax=Plasmodium yoelii TaxID=5861 RepID=A0AAE9WUW2_PLAYO|nr:conserved Plasmodium protein, unknown function [Plasmodium yoelii]WBY59045.1 hypothetical protein Py17XNL_001204937 [Plasmodium yoelii yoelii]CDU19234.1 conserved Plasmodium protein, unknown function [Plasmodium yoelii]VTZ79869.1 conserved Plasmodium protein, unknown function [Plasmodium yoelii]|eukprot:XP_729016.3 conserved Plasmodium protein, unknown function [Plasmodium yoelii]